MFYIQTKNSQYLENMKYEINVALNYKNKILDYKNNIKIKHNKLLIFRINEN